MADSHQIERWDVPARAGAAAGVRAGLRRILTLLLVATALIACEPTAMKTQAPTATLTSSTAAVSSSPSTSPDAPSPPVDYRPSWPEQTHQTARGYKVNTCVPDKYGPRVFMLTTTDGIHLSALALGSGSQGVLLAHERGDSICSWLPLGEELAAAGYKVMLFESRMHGASERVPEVDSMVPDLSAALSELHRRGAHRVLMAGASCGGTASAEVAANEPQLAGLLILSSPTDCGSADAAKAVRSITSPSLFAASPEDFQGNVLENVRKLHAASAATDKHLEVVPGADHGTDMLALDNGLHQTVRDFIDSAFRQ